MNELAEQSNTCVSVCGKACAGVKRALKLPVTERRRKAGFGSLIALLIPGIGFPSGLALLASSNTAPDWLMDPTAWPWEFWVMGLAGTIALIGGLGDWIYHRWVTHCFVGKAERRCELLALAGGGVPMFGLLCAASVSEMPHRFLVPVMIVLMYTTALICYDEFVYHRRRCKRIETLLHRALVFGNGIAFLAWVHWCFVVGGFSGRV